MDNFSKPIGGDAINAFLTCPDGWSDRLLGTNEFVSLPNRTVLQCSGNNLEIEGDTVRRSMVINLDANVERPELLEFERPNILEYVKQRRAELLSDVYTILRGHALAGYPHAAKTRLGSFEGWGKLTAAAVIWCGLDNPIECQKALGEKDETKGMIGRALQAWWDAYETQEKTAGEVCTDTIDNENSSGKFAALTEVIKEAVGVRGNPRSRLGTYFSKIENRIVDGLRMRVRKDKSKKVNVYSVETVA